MPDNRLGNYVRERRRELGLTQEELAERIGGSASQAEVSRLERGTIVFPRRSRLEGLAAALEVTLGALLVHSGWMTNDEGELVDRMPVVASRPDPVATAAMVDEVVQLREMLLAAIERISALEIALRHPGRSVPRKEVNGPAGIFDDWETSTLYPW